MIKKCKVSKINHILSCSPKVNNTKIKEMNHDPLFFTNLKINFKHVYNANKNKSSLFTNKNKEKSLLRKIKDYIYKNKAKNSEISKSKSSDCILLKNTMLIPKILVIDRKSLNNRIKKIYLENQITKKYDNKNRNNIKKEIANLSRKYYKRPKVSVVISKLNGSKNSINVHNIHLNSNNDKHDNACHKNNVNKKKITTSKSGKNSFKNIPLTIRPDYKSPISSNAKCNNDTPKTSKFKLKIQEDLVLYYDKKNEGAPPNASNKPNLQMNVINSEPNVKSQDCNETSSSFDIKEEEFDENNIIHIPNQTQKKLFKSLFSNSEQVSKTNTKHPSTQGINKILCDKNYVYGEKNKDLNININNEIMLNNDNKSIFTYKKKSNSHYDNAKLFTDFNQTDASSNYSILMKLNSNINNINNGNLNIKKNLNNIYSNNERNITAKNHIDSSTTEPYSNEYNYKNKNHHNHNNSNCNKNFNLINYNYGNYNLKTDVVKTPEQNENLLSIDSMKEGTSLQVPYFLSKLLSPNKKKEFLNSNKFNDIFKYISENSKMKNNILKYLSIKDLVTLSYVNKLCYYNSKKKIFYYFAELILKNKKKISMLTKKSLIIKYSRIKNKDIKKIYSEFLSHKSKFDELIKKDLTRTFPNDPQFKQGQPYYNKLYNVLKAYSNYNSSIGYAQGLNFLVGHSLALFEKEEDIFMFLIGMINKFNLQNFYGISSNLLENKMNEIGKYIQRFLPDLHKFLSDNYLTHEFFTANWVLTLFSNHMKKEYLFKIWDFMVIFGWKFFNFFIVSCLEFNKNIIMKYDVTKLSAYMKAFFKNEKFENDFISIISDTLKKMEKFIV